VDIEARFFGCSEAISPCAISNLAGAKVESIGIFSVQQGGGNPNGVSYKVFLCRASKR